MAESLIKVAQASIDDYEFKSMVGIAEMCQDGSVFHGSYVFTMSVVSSLCTITALSDVLLSACVAMDHVDDVRRGTSEFTGYSVYSLVDL